MSDVSGRLKDAAAGAKNKADETVESARSGVIKAADQAADALRSRSTEAMEAGMEAVDQVRDASLSLGDALKTSIERQPFTAISLAAAAGLLFGMLFLRRH
jgi:ElaB/YqjD/DUF883 family membrane-anchored ribosome-binding protein